MKEQIFADGSLDFGGGVVESGTSGVDFYNLPSDLPVTLEAREERPRDNNRFAKTILVLAGLVPKPLQKPAQVALLTTAAGLSAGAVCGADDKSKVEPTSTQVGVGSGQKTEKFNPNAFLRMPMPRDPDAEAVQAWKYSALIRGTYSHNATDFIIGTDGDNSDTWRPFPILAAADGVACVSYYSTSTHGEGNYIKMLHPNGYGTRYLHSETGSLSDRSYPDCKSAKDTWIKIRQGDKLSESGDAGTVSGWTHLHFEVYDPQGNLIDPYDLYSTRTEYPDPNFINGKFCGSKTLWINCPIDESKAQTVPTRAPVPTLAPVPTVAKPVIPTVRLATATAEVVSKKAPFIIHNPLDNVDWEFKFTTYLETPSYVYGQRAPREGWKRIIIKGDLLNLSSGVADPQRMTDLVREGALYKFVLKAGGSPYVLHIGTDQGGATPGRPDSITGSFDHESIASGASRNFLMTADVPQNAGEIDLSLFSKSGSKLAGPITKNEIAAGGDSTNEILPGVEKHDTSEVWNLPGYASIVFGSIKTLPATTAFNGAFSEQFAVFDLTNNYGQDIETDYGLGFEIRNLKVYLPDGRQIDGSKYYYSEEAPQYGQIPPGFTKPVYVRFASNAIVKEGVGGLVDTAGAVVVLTINNKRTSSLESFAWQLQ